MNKPFFGLLFILSLTSTISYGQDVDWDKFEVGIDLLWLIEKNNIPPSFFFKKLALKQSKNDFGFIRRGYRVRVGADYSRPNERSQTNGYPSQRQSSYSFILRPGYEWHKKIKSFDIFYGLDLNTYFSGSKTENSVIYIHSENVNSGFQYLLYTQKNRYARMGLSPVLGTTIKVYKNIGLTLESTIDFYYSHQIYQYTGNPNHEDLEVRGDGFAMSSYPLYTLNVSLSF